jgi:hypothetical protein
MYLTIIIEDGPFNLVIFTWQTMVSSWIFVQRICNKPIVENGIKKIPQYVDGLHVPFIVCHITSRNWPKKAFNGQSGKKTKIGP